MLQSDVVKRIESICEEFDSRVAEVGLAIARLELAKALAENEAAQQPPASGATVTEYEKHSVDRIIAMQARRRENRRR